MSVITRSIGAARTRDDAEVKVRGEATYSYEFPVDRAAYVFVVQSTIAKGRIARIETAVAEDLPGVLAVLTHQNAPPIEAGDIPELAVLQSDRIVYHGQVVAAVVAETLEEARYAAGRIRIVYESEPHAVTLDVERPDLYVPEELNGGYETDTFTGDVEAGLALAPIRREFVYRTPTYHNNPIEMHATIAEWRDDGITLYTSTQGPHSLRKAVAKAIGVADERIRVIAPYIGGGFGSKGNPWGNVTLALIASRAIGRPAKIAWTRQQMFSLAGHRTPTHQRFTIGTETDGRIVSLAHDTIEQSSTRQEFAEQTGVATRAMYRAPNLRTTHLLATCDVPVPSWMRAPGECPGMFGLESAMDEMAVACDIDPVEFRIRNEPLRKPQDDQPFSTRHLVECLREGARRIGWSERSAKPRMRRDGRWLIGLGVASSIYPVYYQAGNTARVTAAPDGSFSVGIGAADMGQGPWTVLRQIAADALEAPIERVTLTIGDTAEPFASVAGGSSGTTSWGSAIVHACGELRRRLSDEFGGRIPSGGVTMNVAAPDNPDTKRFAMYAFGAQFAEVRVDVDTGEVRVPRMCGIFAAGRIINPITARSQLIGGMTMGLSMALLEESVIDRVYGHYANHDLAEYHIATNADVGAIDVDWIDEIDEHTNPMGSKGIGEIGIVGTAAAIANAAYNATGVRVRDLPVTLDKLLLGATGGGNPTS